MAVRADDQHCRDRSRRQGAEAMRYVCLVYFDQNALFAHEADVETCTREGQAFNNDLAARGHLVVSHALAPVAEAMTVSVRDGRMSATDGPFTETKEVLGGFLLIEARDLNEALQIAAEIPLARKGHIEVRPVLDWPRGP
jgi:hypothetical protein